MEGEKREREREEREGGGEEGCLVYKAGSGSIFATVYIPECGVDLLLCQISLCGIIVNKVKCNTEYAHQYTHKPLRKETAESGWSQIRQASYVHDNCMMVRIVLFMCDASQHDCVFAPKNGEGIVCL